jgi:hypothetical protein
MGGYMIRKYITPISESGCVVVGAAPLVKSTDGAVNVKRKIE